MGRPRKTVKAEETPDEVKEETVETDKLVVRILSRGSCPKISKRGVGDLEYEVGIDDKTDEAYIRIAGNASSGAYSTLWIKLDDIRGILENIKEESFEANVLRELYAGTSSCNTGFLGAILKAVGVLVSVDKPPSALKIGSWDTLMKKIAQLKEDGISLTDEIAIAEAEKAKKKQAAISKMKAAKVNPTQKT